ncbi:hypothetical protein CJ030_MR1G018604 [Morella rubra]|uniref:Uncharacterized protein n=1 Tax=Morella rubra TaxID=262757 RepID=A0A6A1WL87_9ROSI|nr:hypothetical protein CJ030_MR1G018604 [Morella rubra]
MKKVLFYNFFPTKAEEEAAKAQNSVHKVTPVCVVEIRDWLPPPPVDFWIEKVVSFNHIATRKLYLTHNETFEYVFRYWTVENASKIVVGNRLYVMIMDITDTNSPIAYQGLNVFFERGAHIDYYALGCKDLLEKKVFHLGDEIGLRWNKELGLFQLKVIKKYQGDDGGSSTDDSICLRI